MLLDLKNNSRATWISIGSIQIMLWTLAYLIVFLYCYYKFEHLGDAIVYATLVTGIYLVVVYGNSHFLIPFFFSKYKVRYIFFSILFLAAVTAFRMWVEHLVLYNWMGYRWFFNYTNEHFSFSFVTVIFAFLFGALLRISIDHFALLRREQERKSHQVTAELNLLKSQVQPHFLFNALNNIYYLAYTKSDKTPGSIARLSDTMRYFVEEAPKEIISLKAELDFIQDYIEVERIRLPYTLNIIWTVDRVASESIFIPPMLIIPSIENVFKHGVDKTKENEVWLSLCTAGNLLIFTAKNVLHQRDGDRPTGTGLSNLRKRLVLLYGDRFTLTAEGASGYFISELKIPLK